VHVTGSGFQDKQPSPAKGGPVPLAHLQELLSHIDPGCDRDQWRNVVAGSRACNVPEDEYGEQRAELVCSWSRGELDKLKRYADELPANYTGDGDVLDVWRTMPPKPNGVGYGTVFNAACAAGYERGPAKPDLAETFKGAKIEEQSTASSSSSKRSRFYPIGEAEMDSLPPPVWILPDVLQEKSAVLIVGIPGGYKSFLVLDLALGIATGKLAWGLRAVQGPVFYAALEGLYGVMGARRKAWKVARQVEGPIADFYAMAAPPLSSQQQCTEFIDQIRLRCDAHADRRRPVLVVLETLNKMLDGQDENSSASASLISKLCTDLIKLFGCTVIVVHHRSDKPGAPDIRGSSGYRGNFDTVISVEADKPTLTATVHVTKQKDAAELEEPLTFQGHTIGPSLVFEPISRAEHREKTEGADRCSKAAVGRALKDLGAYGPPGVTTHVLAEQLLPRSINETEEAWQRQVAAVERLLRRRGKPDKLLDAYAYPGENGARMWYLPFKAEGTK
jgi:hypothetical protein